MTILETLDNLILLAKHRGNEPSIIRLDEESYNDFQKELKNFVKFEDSSLYSKNLKIEKYRNFSIEKVGNFWDGKVLIELL